MSAVSTRWGWFLGIAFAFSGNCALAQITPDGTLPNNSNVTLQGNTFNITGGTQAGSNLFHSFGQFSVPTGGTAFFNNAVDIQNIISRVTGGSISNIDGLIRANGTANLFLINPSGIVFGQNASLNVGGSFVASTADAIQFGNLGFFSASNPNSPALLTINPSALFFNQIAAQPIRYQSIPQPPDSSQEPFPTFADGLRVPDGRSLLLLGGDVNLDGANLTALGGHIELGGLAGTGTIGLTSNGNILSLNFPTGSLLSNVNLANDARVSVRGSGGGDIFVNANTFTAIDGGRLVAGTEGKGNGGDITVNANDFRISGIGSSRRASGLHNQVSPNASGNAGNILVNTQSFDASSGAVVTSNTFGSGKGGNIDIQTGSFSLNDGARLISANLGTGDAGDISVRSDNTISIAADNTAISSGSRLISANNGDIRTPRGLFLPSNNVSRGNAGNIFLQANGRVTIAGLISSGTEFSTIGNAGKITINAGSFSLGRTGYLLASTSGNGNPGNIFVRADGDISIQSGIVTDVGVFDALGNAGNISITSVNGAISIQGGRITSSLQPGTMGNGGNIAIAARSLSITNGAVLETSIPGEFDDGDGFARGGQGNAGKVMIRPLAKVLNA